MAPKKWRTSKEEEALKAGVKEYKAGNWKDILKDPRFASILANRTNIDLKDKWRNLNGGGCVSGPPDKRIVPKLLLLVLQSLQNMHRSAIAVIFQLKPSRRRLIRLSWRGPSCDSDEDSDVLTFSKICIQRRGVLFSFIWG
ncbi:putative transcription factor MYB-HB-like family [Helianthus debilis subsp. tardiflorus]